MNTDISDLIGGELIPASEVPYEHKLALFAEAYGKTLSITEAGVAVGMSRKNALANATRYFKAADERGLIAAVLRERNAEVSGDRVLAERLAMAFLDPIQHAGLCFDKIPAEQRRAMKKWATDADGRLIAVEYWDKHKALDGIDRALGSSEGRSVGNSAETFARVLAVVRRVALGSLGTDRDRYTAYFRSLLEELEAGTVEGGTENPLC
jgi:hypothetical protein